MLEKWTDLLLGRMRSKPDERRNFYKYYLLLEGYFLDGVTAQLKGYALLANAYGVNAPPGETGVELARQIIMPVIVAETSHFLDCVERLALSLHDIYFYYDSDRLGGGWYFWQQAGFAFVRADLLCAGLVSIARGHGPLTMYLGGVYGRYFCAQSIPFTYGYDRLHQKWLPFRIGQEWRTADGRTELYIDDPQLIDVVRPSYDSGVRNVNWLPSEDAFGTVAPVDKCGMYVVRVHAGGQDEESTCSAGTAPPLGACSQSAKARASLSDAARSPRAG